MTDVAEADVAIPPSRRELVVFPSGTDRQELPVRFVSGLVLVRATIGTVSGEFMLDSGAGGMYVDEQLLRRLRIPIIGAGAVVPSFRVGNFEMRDVAVGTLPKPLDLGAEKIVGLLGFDFLAKVDTTIDYEAERVTVGRAGSDTTVPGPNGFSFPMNVGSLGPSVRDVTIAGRPSFAFTLDTGTAGAFVLFANFLSLARNVTPSSPAPVVLQGVGRSYDARSYVVDELSFGHIRWLHASGYGTPNPRSSASIGDGLLGAGFLRLFTVHLDYPEGRVTLIPNAAGRSTLVLPTPEER